VSPADSSVEEVMWLHFFGPHFAEPLVAVVLALATVAFVSSSGKQ